MVSFKKEKVSEKKEEEPKKNVATENKTSHERKIWPNYRYNWLFISTSNLGSCVVATSMGDAMSARIYKV